MENTTALANRPVLEKLASAKPQLLARIAANSGLDQEKFYLGVMTCVQKLPKLLECDPASVLLAAYDAAEAGCSLSPSLQLGWLIPYGKDAQFQASYRFFIQKAHKSGLISAFFAEVVYENDQFNRQFAPKRNLFHAPPETGDRGKPIGAYALVEFVSGAMDWEYIEEERIQRHRRASKAPGSLMWTTFWEEAWRKTAVRILSKRLPQQNEAMEQLAELITRDEQRDLLSIDVAPQPDPPQMPKRKSEAGQTSTATAQKSSPAPPEAQGEAQGDKSASTTSQSAEAPQNGSDEDPLLGERSVENVRQGAFAMGVSAAQLKGILKEKFNVEKLSELRASQVPALTEEINKIAT